MSVFTRISEDQWVAHNAMAFAIRDAYPVSPGHTLVVPRRVVSTWWDATPDEQWAILQLVDTVRRQLDDDLRPDGFNVGFNSGAAAGQTVDHLHVHVIPRYRGDMADPRGGVRHVIPDKGNYLAGPLPAPSSLVTPLGQSGTGRLYLEMIRAFIREELDRIDVVVSFVKRSGLDLFARRIDDALDRGARIRLLTTDYLGITDPRALGFFLDRHGDTGAGHLEARVFSDPTTSFHPKAYIFSSSAGHRGVAFVGSSNFTRSGIETGIEWNMQTHGTGDLLDEFDRLWADERSVPLTTDWLADYHDRQSQLLTVVDADRDTGVDADHDTGVDEGFEPPVEPWSVQREALSALEASRVYGHRAGLVVMATGLGKTWLAAFDSTRPEFRRVLVVAHRNEILTQTRDVFRRIRPGGRYSRFDGSERSIDGDVVFAGVQSLHRHLDMFAPDAFDYVVVDEFHHAAAPTYQKVIGHFRPRFLLGLTATPERADNADLLALCSDNLVYDCDLIEGVRRGLLSPFRYQAIPDVTDYRNIPWRNGRFDLDELTSAVATRRRARQILDQWRTAGGEQRRTIGFCCTIGHAEFMAEYFRDQGIDAVAVHSGPGSADRVESLARLETGDLPVLFTVDIFNEGVDVPSLDLVLMLRPTESSVIFLQQLGRGLRRADGKSRLDVIDLVGNHRGFLLKARILARLTGGRHRTDREAVDQLARHNTDHSTDHGSDGLPDGCSIIVAPEVVDMLRSMLGSLKHDELLVELIDAWRDEHDGARPTALQMTLHTGAPLSLTKHGGWFGFLAAHDLLDDDERAVLAEHADFLGWIERGSYTKSFKLVTLSALLHHGGLRSSVPLAELAATARWMIYRDTDLVADLADATSAFADVMHPTTDEWRRYWRKNPIAALTGAAASSQRDGTTWFVVDDDRLSFTAPIGECDDERLDAMTREIVDYRLHRYLAGRAVRRTGTTVSPMRADHALDATFTVQTTGLTATSVVVESAGGAAGSATARNTDYVAGFDLLLERLASTGARLLDAYIETTATEKLTLADRRLEPGDNRHYPVALADVDDLVSLRSALLRSMATVGRSPGTTRGGNSRERTRLVIATEPAMTAVDLAAVLATGRASASEAPRHNPTTSS